MCIWISDFWLYERVGSSAHTPIKYTHVGSLGFQLFPRLWRIQTSVSHSGLQRGVIHSFVLHDSKSTSLPPHVLFSLPLSSVDLGLPFDPLPASMCFPSGQLRDCIYPFYIATTCGHTPWDIRKNDKQMTEVVCIFIPKIICYSFLTQWFCILLINNEPTKVLNHADTGSTLSAWLRINTCGLLPLESE